MGPIRGLEHSAGVGENHARSVSTLSNQNDNQLSPTSRGAEVAMNGPHSWANVGVQSCWNSDPEPVSAALIDTEEGQTT
ncbi:jg10842 [Pararge aegeria aegeria]|uniref:Jg10842 protein n=1 Tax=Pararge aegeria aegeria TaxID=348720 RepID=A0A8S4SFX3_9NEOP|nr:jg10842 [Pararge aegeria aegeria]